MLLPVPRSRYPWAIRTFIYSSPPYGPAPEVSPARPLGPRDHPRGRAGQGLRRPGVGRGVPRGWRRAAARPVAERPALLRGEPEALRVFPRAARPEGPERLPALWPAGTGRRALTPRLAALLLVALLAASGCGGDDQPAPPPPP